MEWNRKGNLGSYLSETQTTNQQRGKLTQFIGLKDDNNLVHILSYHLHKSGWNLTIKHYCLLESLQTLNVKIKIIKIKNCPGGYSWPHTIHHLPYPPMLWDMIGTTCLQPFYLISRQSWYLVDMSTLASLSAFHKLQNCYWTSNISLRRHRLTWSTRNLSIY